MRIRKENESTASLRMRYLLIPLLRSVLAKLAKTSSPGSTPGVFRLNNKPEFLIKKISLVDYARAKGKLIGGRIECAIAGDHRVPTEQRLSWAFDELDTAIRYGANGLTFPNSSEIVRQWGIRTTVQKSIILEWTTGPGSDALKGILYDKAFLVLDALVTFGGDQGVQIGERILGSHFNEWREAKERHDRELESMKGYWSL